MVMEFPLIRRWFSGRHKRLWKGPFDKSGCVAYGDYLDKFDKSSSKNSRENTLTLIKFWILFFIEFQSIHRHEQPFMLGIQIDSFKTH